MATNTIKNPQLIQPGGASQTPPTTPIHTYQTLQKIAAGTISIATIPTTDATNGDVPVWDATTKAYMPQNHVDIPFFFNSNLTAKNYAENITTVSGNYSLTSTDSTILADTTLQAITLTLPTAQGISGRRYTVKNIGTTGLLLTILTTAGQLIDGSSNLIIRHKNSGVDIKSDSSNWRLF